MAVGVMRDTANNSYIDAPFARGDRTVPNTVLRSRLVGKHLLPAFPSILPQNTILDCILDQNWTRNGILHVLDVIKWKGQDIGGCETSFRWVICFPYQSDGRLDYAHTLSQVLVAGHPDARTRCDKLQHDL